MEDKMAKLQESQPASKGQTTTVSTYQAPKGVRHRMKFSAPGQSFSYQVEADWMVLHHLDEPTAEMFFTSYIREDNDPKRPITFVFNGGPGAASAYLHLGALGPKRVQFSDQGQLLPPPVQIVDNHESWLPFTDLVFIDPVGTGFSRPISAKALGKTQAGGESKSDTEKSSGSGAGKSGRPEESKEFYHVQRDLESLGEFIQKCLTRYGRWTSPVCIAGESYGGFRVGRLARKLQESYGVGLNGAILISPALEFFNLFGNDYDSPFWVDLFPSLVASAWVHRRGIFAKKSMPLEKALALGEQFALSDLNRLIMSGDILAESDRDGILQRCAELCGLSAEYVKRKQGRIAHMDFVRELLRDQRLVCGLYDASITAVDPFPDRDTFQGPEPTLSTIDRVFNSGINAVLREWLKVESEREYRILSNDVFENWQGEAKRIELVQPAPGAADDLRYAMSLNPHMKVFITHGYFDLVTPYFSANRLASLMRLTVKQRANLTLQHFLGGHMFYSWADSRKSFKKCGTEFYSFNG